MIVGLGAVLLAATVLALRSPRVPRLVIVLSCALGGMALLVLILQAALIGAASGPSVLVWTPHAVSQGAFIFMIGAVSLLAGAILGGGRVPELRRENFDRYRIQLERVMAPILAISYALVGGWIVGRGVSALIIRNLPITDADQPQLVAFLVPFLPLAFGVGALARFSGRRVSGRLLMVLVVVCSIANATRLLGLLPIIWLIVRQLFRPARPLVVVAAGILSWLGIELALNLRAAPFGQHGLLPYAAQLTNGAAYVGEWKETVANIVFAVPLAGTVDFMNVFNMHALAVSVDPLPGALSDWNAIAPSLRVHTYIPFNAFGELSSLSLVALCAFFLAFGALASRVLVLAQRRGPLWLMTAGAAVIFTTVLLLQYNLRSGMRIVYLLVALLLALLLQPRMRLRRQQQPESSPPRK